MTKVSIRRSVGRPRSKSSHQSILDAALELLSEKGFSAMTVEEVAARSGTSKATIYRRWPSKLYLTVAAFEVIPPLTPPDKGGIEKDLHSFIEHYINLMMKTPLGKVFPSLVGECAHNPELIKLIGPVFDRRRDPGRIIMRRAIARSELKADTDVELLQDMIMGPLTLRMFITAAAPSKKYVKTIVAKILEEFGAR